MSALWWCKPLRERFLPMLHVPIFATTDAHERYCRAVIERAGMVTHSETTVGLERRALEAIQRLGFREAEILAVNGQVQKADAFRKMIRANMLHRDKDRVWGPVRARGPSALRRLDPGRFQRMTEPSTSSSGPCAAAGSQQARGSVHATTARVPADYSGWREPGRLNRANSLAHDRDPRDAGGMTWEDVDEAAKVWAERNRIEFSNGECVSAADCCSLVLVLQYGAAGFRRCGHGAEEEARRSPGDGVAAIQAAEAAFDDLQPVIATEASVEQSWVGHEGQAQSPGVVQAGQGEVSGREHICYISILAVQGAGMRTQDELFLALCENGAIPDSNQDGSEFAFPDMRLEVPKPQSADNRVSSDANRGKRKERGSWIMVKSATHQELKFSPLTNSSPGEHEFSVASDREAVGAVLRKFLKKKLFCCLKEGHFAQYRLLLNQQQSLFRGLPVEPIEDLMPSEDCNDDVVEAFLFQNGFRKASEYYSAGWSPLCYAAMKGDPILVEALLSSGGNPNDKTRGARPEINLDTGTPILSICAKFKNHQALELLIQYRACVNSKAVHTPLGQACIANDAIGVRLLCNAKADPHMRNPFGDHALNMAAANGSSEAMDALLLQSSGFDLSTTLHCAVLLQGGSSQAVHRLLEVKAKVAERVTGDTWCLGCASWEAIERELCNRWPGPAGLRAVAESLVLNAARETRALRSLSAGLGLARGDPRAGTPSGGEPASRDAGSSQATPGLAAKSAAKPSPTGAGKGGDSEYTYKTDTDEEDEKAEEKQKPQEGKAEASSRSSRKETVEEPPLKRVKEEKAPEEKPREDRRENKREEKREERREEKKADKSSRKSPKRSTETDPKRHREEFQEGEGGEKKKKDKKKGKRGDVVEFDTMLVSPHLGSTAVGAFLVTHVTEAADGSIELHGRCIGCDDEEVGKTLSNLLNRRQFLLHLCRDSPCTYASEEKLVHTCKARWFNRHNFEAEYMKVWGKQVLKEYDGETSKTPRRSALKRPASRSSEPGGKAKRAKPREPGVEEDGLREKLRALQGRIRGTGKPPASGEPIHVRESGESSGREEESGSTEEESRGSFGGAVAANDNTGHQRRSEGGALRSREGEEEREKEEEDKEGKGPLSEGSEHAVAGSGRASACYSERGDREEGEEDKEERRIRKGKGIGESSYRRQEEVRPQRKRQLDEEEEPPTRGWRRRGFFWQREPQRKAAQARARCLPRFRRSRARSQGQC
eukprot:s1948_g24.t1